MVEVPARTMTGSSSTLTRVPFPCGSQRNYESAARAVSVVGSIAVQAQPDRRSKQHMPLEQQLLGYRVSSRMDERKKS